MELILISDSKLKIMLTANDMETYEISSEALTYERKDTRRLFDRILDEAKKKTGFDSTVGNLFIQVYPSKNGGCEVYVTRIDVDDDISPKQDKRPKDKGSTPKKKKEYCIYRFGEMSDVLSACRALKDHGYKNDSEMYVEKTDKLCNYYLVLQEEIIQNTTAKKRKNVCKSDIANEFGRRVGGKEMMMYIKEHTENIIRSDAVNVLGVLE